MADDVKFVIGVDDTDILKSIKNHEILERRVEELTKEYARLDKLQNKGRLSAQAYAKAVQQLDKQIDQLNGVLRKGGSAVDQLATGMNVSGKAVRRNEIAFQQAGYQVQDFIVQVQGGTNPLIAFSQQASQLAGFFAGPWGAMIGLGIAAGSSLALAFQALGSEAEDAKGKIMSLADAQKALNEATADYQTKIDMLKFGVDSEEEVRVLQELLVARKEDQRIRDDMAATDSQRTRLRLSKELKENRVVLFQLQEDAKSHADKRAEYDALKAAERAASEKKVTDAKRAASMAEDERMLGEQMADKARQEALAIFNADLAATAATLDSVFKSRTLFYSIRFAGEETVMGQSLTPSPMKPKQSYEELLAMGVSPDALLGMGLKPKKKSAGGGSSKKSPAEELQEYLEKLQEQAYLENQLVGIFGEKRNTEEEVIKARQKYGEVFGATQEAELRGTLAQIEADKERQRVLEEARAQQEEVASVIADNFGSAFMSIVDGTKTAKEAFKDMARAIIKQLFQILVVEKMVNSIRSFISPSVITAQANGGAWQGGSQIKAYANGGVVGGPTYFPMAGGKTGLMGEAGPEAIMPLKRGKDGKLGVQMEGNGGGTVSIVQNFNISANGDDSVKRIVRQQIPQIAEATKAAVVDAKRRGGSYGRAFS